MKSTIVGVSVIKNPCADIGWGSVNACKANLPCYTIYRDGSAEPTQLIGNFAAAGY